MHTAEFKLIGRVYRRGLENNCEHSFKYFFQQHVTEIGQRLSSKEENFPGFGKDSTKLKSHCEG